MKISARNQIKVAISNIEKGAVNSFLTLTTKLGTQLGSSITNSSVEAMDLHVGEEVICFFKASNVLVATDIIPNISAKNKIVGTVKTIKIGAVNSEVVIVIENSDEITAIITNDAVEDLGLKEGDKAVAIIKANEVMLAK